MSRSLFAVLVLLGLAACQETSSPAAAPATVRVALTHQPQSALVHVALAKGYFRDENLDVQAKPHDFGKAALATVVAGEVDFALATETATMFSLLDGEPLAIVATVGTSSTNNAVIARKAAGIATAANLKGKRVAFTPGTSSEFFLDSLLAANGLTRNAIVPVAMRPQDVSEAMTRAEVDAASTWAYWLLGIDRRLGANAVVFYDRELYTQSFTMVANRDFVRQNRATVVRFLRALREAEAFLKDDRSAAQALVAQAMKVDETFAGELLDRFDYRVALDRSLVITLEDQARWAIENGLTDRRAVPDFAAYMEPDALREIRPQLVRLER